MPETARCERRQSLVRDDFSQHVIDGLCAQEKKLHPKYFYDQQGSAYFDQICELREYYPYKAELALLPKVARDAARLLTDQYALIEFGAGSLLKVKPLLQAIHGIAQFVPIDISGAHLRDSCAELQRQYPQLNIQPVAGDFTQTLDFDVARGLKRLGFFPGSTIGNFSPSEAKDFLINARTTLGCGSYMLVGVDTKKSPLRLHKAYNDEDGVTAKFNLNILERINGSFDSPFDLNTFEHYAYYNVRKGCIEMHLMSLQDQRVYLDEVAIDFSLGESIHTESSYKYSPHEFKKLVESAGWKVEKLWLAEEDLFSTFLLRYVNNT